jgi:ribosomal protein S18 acetylase RimI-like enzyme
MRLGICASFFYLMTGQDADKVLGTILLRKRFSLAARGYHWKIHAVYVDPELRGRGLGVELVRFALGELAGWRVAEVSLKVDEDNEPAIRLYRKCGFEEKEKANGQLIMVKTVEQARERRRLP